MMWTEQTVHRNSPTFLFKWKRDTMKHRYIVTYRTCMVATSNPHHKPTSISDLGGNHTMVKMLLVALHVSNPDRHCETNVR